MSRYIYDPLCRILALIGFYALGGCMEKNDLADEIDRGEDEI